ncbi:MAG: NAD-dependent protein deacylase, partial [Verrucomicrobia bacterium]
MEAAEPRFDPQLLETLRRARSAAVLTGAGFSAESGVPTFRDAQTGLWARFRPEELATPEAFAAHPRRVWEWYAWRRRLVARAQPHAGHRALVVLQERLPRLCVITQNVDGLHQRSGSREVIELHGNIMRNRCSGDCGVIEEPVPDEPAPPP